MRRVGVKVMTRGGGLVAAVLAVVATRGRPAHNEMAANTAIAPTVASAPPDGADLDPFALSDPESQLSD